MKKTALTSPIIITTIILFFLTTTASAQGTNFSGTWKRNNYKTDGGGLSIDSVPVSLEIVQDASTITIKGNNKSGAGEVSTYTDVLKLDGSPAERKISNGQVKHMTITWTADKQGLLQNSVYKDEHGSVVRTLKQIYSLQEAGKTLRVLTDLDDDGETNHLTEVFDKQ